MGCKQLCHACKYPADDVRRAAQNAHHATCESCEKLFCYCGSSQRPLIDKSNMYYYLLKEHIFVHWFTLVNS